MKSVFIINEPKGSRLRLTKYGRPVIIAPGWVDGRNIDKACAEAVEELTNGYHDGDYICFGQLSKVNCVVFHWVMTKHGVLRHLNPTGKQWQIITHDGRIRNDGTRSEWWLPQCL